MDEVTIIPKLLDSKCLYSVTNFMIAVVRISPHYRGSNDSLVPIGHKGWFLPFENSKKKWNGNMT